MRAAFNLKWIVLGALLSLAGPGSASAVAPAPVQIAIGAMTFSAPASSVHVGDTVEWVNNDVVDHTATEKKASLWNVSIAPGKRAGVVMRKAGTFDYYCRYHPNMVAKLVVTAGRPKC